MLAAPPDLLYRVIPQVSCYTAAARVIPLPSYYTAALVLYRCCSCYTAALMLYRPASLYPLPATHSHAVRSGYVVLGIEDEAQETGQPLSTIPLPACYTAARVLYRCPRVIPLRLSLRSKR